MTDLFADDTDPTRDRPRTRPLELDADNDFFMTQEDPYGFWFLSRKHGQVPDKLAGAYTTAQNAREAAELYVRTNKPVKSDLPERPILKTKKVKTEKAE